MADLQTLFPSIPEERLEAASKRFFRMDREADEVVVEEGEIHDSMFIIESGTVKVAVGGFDVAELGPGACVGEIGLFTTSVRTATVTAVTPVSFLLLSRPAFQELKDAGNPVAGRIERRAVGQLGARLRKLVADIRVVAPNARGLLLEPIQTRQTEGFLAPFPESGIQAALEAMTIFQGALPAAFPPLAELGELRAFRKDDTIAAVGRRDGPMQILVKGRVDCLVTLEADQVRAATLSGGEAFNMLPFVDGQPRPLSYVAADQCTVLTLDRAGVRKLMQEAGPVASALRIAMIRSLSDRVNQANATFSLAKLTRLEVDSATPMPAPTRSPILPPETLAALKPPADIPPEPANVPPPPEPVPEPTPELAPPSEELPGFDPRHFVPPAPLSVGARKKPEGHDGPEGYEVDETPWFDTKESDWDTWFELTDEVSL